MHFEIHGFSGSFKSAYAAIICTRVITTIGEIFVNLLIAKTKVAPLRTLSIAKLELYGAELLANLVVFSQESLKIPNSNIYCWTDSAIVLFWLRKQPTTWNVFVANRVKN